MTISIWRYSHLALAISSFLLLTLASVTGIILAFEPISEKLKPYGTDNFEQITLAESIPPIRKQYPGISELTVDANQFVKIKGIDKSGTEYHAFINPISRKILGEPSNQSAFFEWVTALHRSLFIHEAGRFFIGLTAFLLMLITVSGTILIVQRQRGLKHFFTKIVRDNFAQYYHVVLGRFSLIPIFIIALTGTYLSLARFEIIETPITQLEVDFDNIKEEPEISAADFDFFTTTKLSEVQSIEFPFSEFPEDYYKLKLKDREVILNQITGEVLAEAKYPVTVLLTNLSVNLHTGKTSAIWAILLAIATGNILFFIYSGFAITIKRRANRTKNKYKASESEYIILVGSENGSTFGFANAILNQLLEAGKRVHLTELNNYTNYPKATNIVVISATYGLGNPPTNANQFSKLIEKHPQNQPIQYSVVGFGSHGYPDFCKFAFEIDNLLARQTWATPLVEIHTVNDKSPAEFNDWAQAWAQKIGLPLTLSSELVGTRSEPTETLTVISKTAINTELDSFLIRLRPNGTIQFQSGDLLAIYPANDHRERLYSIGKIGKDIQLSVKLHPQGLGSSFLYQLEPGKTTEAKIISNEHFHLPPLASNVMLISNGTGIAPFLGMIEAMPPENTCHLYCGFRNNTSYNLYKEAIDQGLAQNKLKAAKVALSREGEKQYVKELIEKDNALVVDVLQNGGVIMLCGSLAMQNNVVELLDTICQTHLCNPVSFYQSHGQILMDCY